MIPMSNHLSLRAVLAGQLDQLNDNKIHVLPSFTQIVSSYQHHSHVSSTRTEGGNEEINKKNEKKKKERVLLNLLASKALLST
jgi:hypothetical protein